MQYGKHQKASRKRPKADNGFDREWKTEIDRRQIVEKTIETVTESLNKNRLTPFTKSYPIGVQLMGL
jgi:hypothetical protein